MGKTRLLIEAGHLLRPAFADSVSFVSLAAIADPDENVFDQYDEAENYELTDEARAMLSNPARFREEFGDYFIAGLRRFPRFTAIYRCQASSAESMEEFKASLGAETPQLFSAEGSARFLQLARTHNVSLEIQIGEHGFIGNSPYGPPWDVNKILQELEWCKKNLGGASFQAKLAHYSMVASGYPQTVPIAPSVFVELRQLYTTIWDVRTRYDSCPPAYKDQFKKEAGISA